MKLALLMLFLSGISYGQTYEYAEMQSVVKGFKLEITFNFGTKYDSTEAYGKHRYTVDALDYAAKRGWELVEVSKFQVMDIYILRRRRE